jgi:hypothetical protein
MAIHLGAQRGCEDSGFHRGGKVVAVEPGGTSRFRSGRRDPRVLPRSQRQRRIPDLDHLLMQPRAYRKPHTYCARAGSLRDSTEQRRTQWLELPKKMQRE